MSAAAVEVGVMISGAIVALCRGLLTRIGVIVLAGLLPVGALAETAQTLSAAQTVAAADSHSDAGSAGTAASTVFKIPAATVGPAASNAAVQPVPKAPDPATNAALAVQSQIDGAELLSPAQRRTFQRAASEFGAFCHDWERLLHEREVNNLEHLSWRKDGDLETAIYTGYGKLESCECKASKEGLPIGKIRYQEINYSIAGKTINLARHAAPKLTHEINTLEIFSWDKGKWFY
jgi:hypothetical protein